MRHFIKIISTLILLILMGFSLSSQAQLASSPPGAVVSSAGDSAAPAPHSKLSLQLSPYSVHFKPKPTHRHVYLIGLEKNYTKRQPSWVGVDYDFVGLSYFSNSFGQPSAYGYVGRTYRPTSNPDFFIKVSAGLIYGYRGEFKDQAGKSFGGFTPVIVPSLGWDIDQQSAFVVNVLGTAGAMFMYTRVLD